jgi:GT2 family glycosyltransferase
MKLGIFILHYNTPEMTHNMCSMLPEAIVIDNGSTILSEFKNEVHRQPNLGFTKGWNAAVKHFYNRFEAFWLMNSDIVISRKSVDRICQLAEREDVHFITPSFNCWMKHCRNQNSGGLRNVKVIEYTAPMIKKSVFEKIGFFDESFSLGWGVEFDFCYRAASAGFIIHVDDGSNFFHIGHKSIIKTGKDQQYYARAAQEWKISMQRKYGSQWQFKLYGNENFRKEIKYAGI